MRNEGVEKFISSLRQLIDRGARVILEKSGVQILNPEIRQEISSGPYDRRFWWLNDQVSIKTMEKVRNQVVVFYSERAKNDTVDKNEKQTLIIFGDLMKDAERPKRVVVVSCLLWI